MIHIYLGLEQHANEEAHNLKPSPLHGVSLLANAFLQEQDAVGEMSELATGLV